MASTAESPASSPRDTPRRTGSTRRRSDSSTSTAGRDMSRSGSSTTRRRRPTTSLAARRGTRGSSGHRANDRGRPHGSGQEFRQSRVESRSLVPQSVRRRVRRSDRGRRRPPRAAALRGIVRTRPVVAKATAVVTTSLRKLLKVNIVYFLHHLRRDTTTRRCRMCLNCPIPAKRRAGDRYDRRARPSNKRSLAGSQNPKLLRPGWSSGRRPKGQRNFRSSSRMGRSLMDA